MSKRLLAGEQRGLAVGALVEAGPGLGALETPDGEEVPSDRLGVGVVSLLRQDRGVFVEWVGVGFNAWIRAEKHRPLGLGTRLVTIVYCHAKGRPIRPGTSS